MANRKLPFGYRMENGQVCVEEAEAEIVRMIFSRYGEGTSYETLAKSLNGGTVPYAPGRPWNKNMVARVLRDRRYLGDETYPALVTAERFANATPDHAGRLTCPQIKDIRILARCPACDGAVRRERRNAWRCPHCMTTAARTTDKRLIADVNDLLRWLLDHPEAVAVPAVTVEEFVTAAEDKATAMATAAGRLNALDSADYEAMRIRYILAQAEPEDNLLRQITSAVLLYPDGTVQLQLRNRQIIKKESDCT